MLHRPVSPRLRSRVASLCFASFLLTGASGVSTSSAVAAACTGTANAAYVLTAPKELAVGRTGWAYVSSTYYSSGASAATLGVLPSNPAVPIAAPIPERPVEAPKEKDRDKANDPSDFDSQPNAFTPITVQPGESALVVANWTETEYGTPGGRCERQATQLVTAVEGEKPKVSTSIDQKNWFQIELEWPELLDCNQARPGRLSLTIKTRGQQGSSSFDDACTAGLTGDPDDSDRLGGYETSGRVKGKIFDLGPNENGQSWAISSAESALGIHQMTWRLTFSGKTIGKGSFWTRYVPSKTRIIWEEQDDFVNICINETKTLKKKGGRLYCAISSGGYDLYSRKKPRK